MSHQSINGLVAKWRKEAAPSVGSRQEHDADSAYDDALERCADELEAALATPEQPGSAVQGENLAVWWREPPPGTRFLSDVEVRFDGINTIGWSREEVRTTPPPAPAAEQGEDDCMNETIGELLAKGFKVTIEPDDDATQPEARGVEDGDYVLATKYADGDPGDQWAVGFYDGQRGGRHYVIDAHGSQFRGNGFRRVQRIEATQGRYLLDRRTEIEVSGRSLWDWLAAAPAAPGAGVGVDDVDAKRWDWLSDEHAKENSRLAVYWMGQNGPESPIDYDGLEEVVDRFMAEDAALAGKDSDHD